MRIAILNTIRAYGGGEKWVLRAAHGFERRGYKTTVVGDPDGVLASRCREAQLDFLPVRLGHYLAPASVFELANAFRIGRFDTIVCCNELAVRVGALTRWTVPGLANLPLVYRNGLEGSFKNKPFNRHVVAPRVCRFVVNAEATRQELRSFGWIPTERLHLIYNGVDPAMLDGADPQSVRASLGVGPNDMVLMMAARMVPEKGHALLLRSLPQLGALQERVHVWLAGEGPEERSIRALLQELNLGDRVQLLGFRTDISRLLRAADVLCHPSRREGAPNIVLEAMVAGLPVVAAAASGTGELVLHGTTGLLSPPDDVEAYTRNLATVIEDVALRRRLGAAGRERALAEFTEDRSVDRWLALLEECRV